MAIPVASMSEEHLHFEVLPWNQRCNIKLSQFDLLLRQSWDDALKKGVFLHEVESEPSRVEGDRKFVAVLCKNRASQKRKPQSFMSIKQPINLTSFNFTKVKKAEKLFTIDIENIEDITSSETPEELGFEGNSNKCDNFTNGNIDSERQHSTVPSFFKTSIIINNSPYEFGHSLLVPEVYKLHIQSITLNAIKMGIEVLLRSSHTGFRVMYNSLCAGASVNHLHLHCYYTEYWLNSEAFRMIPLLEEFSSEKNCKNVLSDCFELDFNDSCVRGFGFLITKQNYAFRLPLITHKIVEYFNANEIPHNIVIIRGLPPSGIDYTAHSHCFDRVPNGQNSLSDKNGVSQYSNIPEIKDDATPYHGLKDIDPKVSSIPLVGRLYIYPRKPLYGEKCYRKFLVNVTELMGHLYFGDIDVFNSMNENDIVKALNDVSLSSGEFENVKTDVIKIILSCDKSF
uniref:GDP-D-glucose phosphorylase 1-like n=1 Tax=Styela clava TaxID=7725 RepID=UPI00193A08B1|nr:GDP-D-glucose phosphorylase 1-like [Styela clava]